MWRSVGNFFQTTIHHYLATNFHLNDFFLLWIIFLSCSLLEMMYHYILFLIFCKLSLFLCFVGAYAMQERSHNISHLQLENPSHKAIWPNFRSSFTKFLRNLIMISICERVSLQQLRKTKHSASISLISQDFFLAEPHTCLCNTL